MRPSCHSCRFHCLDRPGEVTIGDFWGIEKYSSIDPRGGVSLVLVRDDQEELIDALGCEMAIEEHEIPHAVNERQPTLSHPMLAHAGRAGFFAALQKKGFSRAMFEVYAKSFLRKFLPKGRRVSVKNSRNIAADVVFPDGTLLKNRLVQSTTDCCGCGTCSLVCPMGAISMERDNEGFVYPRIDEEKCTNCSLCEAACSFALDKKASVTKPGIRVFAAVHHDVKVKSSSSSGGAFWALASYALDQEGVVYGCSFDADLNPRHIRCETLSDVKKCQGSKYAQSDSFTVFEGVKKDLKQGKTVLFSGTPCQVAALKHYLKIKKLGIGD